ncbi:MAG: hypothetical protein ABGX20_21345 [Bacillus sp. (in: firmicutes)]
MLKQVKFFIVAGSKNIMFGYNKISTEFRRILSSRTTAVRINNKNLTKEELTEVETNRIVELQNYGEASFNKIIKGTIPVPLEKTKVH